MDEIAATAATNYASACQSLLQALPEDQRNAIARAVVVVVGTDGTKAVFEVDGADPADTVGGSVRDLLVFGGLSDYIASLRSRLLQKINA